MSILEKIATRSVLATLWLMLKELRRLNHAIEQGVDTFRAVHGHRPIFHQQDAQVATEPAETRAIPRFESDEPDWLKLDLIAELCRENHIAVTEGMDLFQTARELGWLDESGKFTTLPQHYGE